MARPRISRAEAEKLLRAYHDATRSTWKVGDLSESWHGRPPSRIARLDGESAVLEDGTSMHRSHLRTPKVRAEQEQADGSRWLVIAAGAKTGIRVTGRANADRIADLRTKQYGYAHEVRPATKGPARGSQERG